MYLCVCHLLVISFSNASAKPHAVMIELDDTDVADVTVTASRRSKSEACLTEFELEEHRRMGQTDLEVEDS